MPEGETPEVKIFEEPTERFMIIKAGLAPDETTALLKTLEDLEARLRKTLVACRELADTTKADRAADTIQGNLIDIRKEDLERFEHGIYRDGFYPHETFAALKPLTEGIIKHANDKLSAGSAPDAYPHIRSAAIQCKDFLEAHQHEARELPPDEGRIQGVQVRISRLCSDIIHALGAAPEKTGGPVDLAKIKKEAQSIPEHLQAFTELTKQILPDVRTNPGFEVNLKHWVERGVFYIKEIRTAMEGITLANSNQPASNMAFTLASFSKEAAAKLDKLQSSPTSSTHMDKAGIKDLLRAVQELGALSSGGGGNPVKEIKDEVRHTSMACGELLPLLEALSTTPFYGTTETPPAEDEKKIEEEEREEEKEADTITKEEEEIDKKLKEEIDKLNADLLSKVRAEENAVNQLSHYLTYLMQVRGWNKPYKDEEALKQVLPQLIKLAAGFEFKLHELHDKYNFSVWTKFWKPAAEEQLRKLVAIESTRIEDLRKRVLKTYQSKKGKKGKLGLEEDKKYNQFYTLVARIQKKLRERNDKLEELTTLVTSIPAEISKHTRDSMTDLVKKVQNLQKTKKDHCQALNECIDGLSDFIAAHNQMAKISRRIQDLVKGIETLERSWEINALKEGRELQALLTQLRFKEEGGIIKKA